MSAFLPELELHVRTICKLERSQQCFWCNKQYHNGNYGCDKSSGLAPVKRLHASMYPEQLDEHAAEISLALQGSSCSHPWRCHRSIKWHSFLYQVTQVSEKWNSGSAANSTVTEEWQTMDRADISAIREDGQTKDSTDNSESALLSRMKELGETLGGEK